MNVIVTLPLASGGLKHLQEKIQATRTGRAFWEFTRPPKHLIEGDRIYIVCEGAVRGFFIADELSSQWFGDLVVYLDNWNALGKPIPMKGFQGFRYASRCTSLNDETRKMLGL